jgi:hypothetical protein
MPSLPALRSALKDQHATCRRLTRVESGEDGWIGRWGGQCQQRPAPCVVSGTSIRRVLSMLRYSGCDVCRATKCRRGYVVVIHGTKLIAGNDLLKGDHRPCDSWMLHMSGEGIWRQPSSPPLALRQRRTVVRVLCLCFVHLSQPVLSIGLRRPSLPWLRLGRWGVFFLTEITSVTHVGETQPSDPATCYGTSVTFDGGQVA